MKAGTIPSIPIAIRIMVISQTGTDISPNLKRANRSRLNIFQNFNLAVLTKSRTVIVIGASTIVRVVLRLKLNHRAEEDLLRSELQEL